MGKVNTVQVVEHMRELSAGYARRNGTQPALNAQVAMFLAIAYAECFGTRTEHDLRDDLSNSAGNEPAGSVDRGMWMLNSHWWGHVSDACAYDWPCATAAVCERTRGFTANQSQWVAYTNGYQVHLPIAWMAIRVADARARERAAGELLAACNAERERLHGELADVSARAAVLERKIADALPFAEDLLATLR